MGFQNVRARSLSMRLRKLTLTASSISTTTHIRRMTHVVSTEVSRWLPGTRPKMTPRFYGLTRPIRGLTLSKRPKSKCSQILLANLASSNCSCLHLTHPRLSSRDSLRSPVMPTCPQSKLLATTSVSMLKYRQTSWFSAIRTSKVMVSLSTTSGWISSTLKSTSTLLSTP